MPKVDLRTQVQGVLPRVFGGTDNEYGAASKWLLVNRINDFGAQLPLGTLVNMDDGIYPTTTSGEKVSGVIVGRYDTTTGKLEEAHCEEDEVCAVAVAGVAMVLTASACAKGQYVAASFTDGAADPFSSVVQGTFGHVVLEVSSGKALVLLSGTGQSAPVGATFATPAIVLGSSAAAGAAGTVIRSDSTIAAFDATSPTTQAIGDAAAVGTAAFATRRDHKHAMPAFGTGPAAVGTQANGSSANIARIDHVHATGAGTPTTAAAGDTAATGTGPAASMTDHRHGMPAFVGELLISDIPSTPLIFADLIQNEGETDLVYADT